LSIKRRVALLRSHCVNTHSAEVIAVLKDAGAKWSDFSEARVLRGRSAKACNSFDSLWFRPSFHGPLQPELT